MREDGFTIIENSILEDRNISMQEQSVLIAILSYLNKEKGYSYPSYLQLKLRSKIKDNRTLQKAVNSLVEKGYIKKETIKGVGCKYYISKPSGNLHLVENYTTRKNTLPPSGELHEDVVENYTTTNTKTNTKTNKKEKGTSIDEIINSYTQNEGLRNTLKEFLKMRKSIKKPMTDGAMKILLNKLNKLGESDNEKIAILEQSIFNSWQGIFELKNKVIGNSNKKDVSAFIET